MPVDERRTSRPDQDVDDDDDDAVRLLLCVPRCKGGGPFWLAVKSSSCQPLDGCPSAARKVLGSRTTNSDLRIVRRSL